MNRVEMPDMGTVAQGGPVDSVRRSWRRTGVGVIAAGAGLAATTAALVPLRPQVSLPSVVLLYLIPVLLTAALGGWVPAVAAAAGADLLVNYFFIPPFRTFAVEAGDSIVVLAVYVGVAVAVSLAVDLAARHRATAARRDTEAALLAVASSQPIEQSLARLLEEVRTTYRMTTVALAEQGRTVERVGPAPHGQPALSVAAGGGLRLLGWGPQLFAEDRRALARLAAAAARALHTQRLAGQAAHAEELAHIDRVRAALLGAVGHDLRTPLAGIKAAVSSLRQPDVDFTAHDRAELLATVEESTDRLTAVVDNLLALSRLQAGVLSVDNQPTALDAVVARAALATDTGGVEVHVDVPDDLPLALADPGLLERVVANLLANACTATPPGRSVQIRGHADDHQLQLQVIDHGPGIAVEDRDRVFAPFQRLDDHSSTGLGLGLAIARGFTEAQGGTLTPSDTPNGGLTMTIALPAAVADR
ncbi:ATP-binding protein [Micromonospora sp. KC207]|uniref:sensor histidine kinase n=1 Tax=Micromonospora sp. KC207 TaxID=2530377 RepID=UPI001A9F7354|nr:ATP-binding protein [Micromonospora sp. KC207]